MDKNKEDKKLEESVCEMIDKRFNEAKQYRQNFEGEWEECEEFYAGKHWKDKNRTYKNILFPLVEQEVSLLCDSMPGTDVLAYKETPEAEEGAKILENGIHFVYEQQNLMLKQVQSVRSMLKTGNGFQYVDFDPDAEGGEGTITIKNLGWKHVYFDPAASDIDECSFVGIELPTRIDELKRRFPQHANKIEAQKVEFGSSHNSNGREDRGSISSTQNTQPDRYKGDGLTVVREAWIRDFQMVDIPEEETAEEIAKETEEFFNQVNPDITRFEHHAKHIEAHLAQKVSIAAEALGLIPQDVTEADIENLKLNDPEIGLILELIDDHIKIHEQYALTNPENKKPKYAESLRLVIKTGTVVLYDGPAPVQDGLVPLVPYYAYKEEESIYAFGEIKNVLSSQKSYNEMDNAEYESLHLTSNPGWVMSNDAGVDPSTITNKRGKVYIVNPGSEFRRLEPGQTSPQLSMRKAADAQAMYDISGINEASQGKQPGGINAAKAIERLQQSTAGRVRLKASQIALYSMPRLGKLVASRIVKYWTTERILRINDPETGKAKSVLFDPEKIKNLDYMIRVVPGSLAGVDKEAILSVLERFVDKGWLPPKVFFQATDVPFKRKILEELEKNDQQAMLLEQLAAENEQLKAQLNGMPAAPMPEEMPAPEAAPMAPQI